MPSYTPVDTRNPVVTKIIVRARHDQVISMLSEVFDSLPELSHETDEFWDELLLDDIISNLRIKEEAWKTLTEVAASKKGSVQGSVGIAQGGGCRDIPSSSHQADTSSIYHKDARKQNRIVLMPLSTISAIYH